MTRDRQVDLNKKPDASIQEDKAVLDYFKKPSKLIKTDGIVADTARGITQGKKSDVDKARAIYAWIVENTFRAPKVRGGRVGGTATVRETGTLGGKWPYLEARCVGPALERGLWG